MLQLLIKPYGKSYTVGDAGKCRWEAVWFVTSTCRWNLKELAIAQMQTGELFGLSSDVGQPSNRKAGILATDVYDLESSMDPTSPRQGRTFDHSASLMTQCHGLDRC